MDSCSRKRNDKTNIRLYFNSTDTVDNIVSDDDMSDTDRIIENIIIEENPLIIEPEAVIEN